jgi:murein DD-endopeptidase MepM/ murein hydrolase activator NlpD
LIDQESMRKLLIVLTLLVLAASLTRAAAQSNIVVSLNFEFVRQGGAGIIRLNGPALAGAAAVAFDRTYTFFPTADGFAAILAVPYDTRIREHPLSITIYDANGGSAQWSGTVRVASGEFIREPQFAIPSDRFFLLQMEIQEDEDDRLRRIYSGVTPQRFWEGQLSAPVNAPTTSPFGSVRDFNDGSTRRHLGLDFTVSSGTPILASGTGRVVFARNLDIHGLNVIIDHGWGVFTNYSHLQEVYVVPGQIVLQGEIIGLSGNSGRSTGPHLHWEIAVNGVLVNPLPFTSVKLPT